MSLFDVISVEMLGIPELSRTVEVDASGMVTLPLIGTVQTLGLTSNGLARQIEARYRGPYVRAPSVSVRVIQRQQRSITVTGSVKKAGIFAVGGPMTLTQAIAMAEGVDGDTYFSAVRLFRQSEAGTQVGTYDLRAIQSGLVADPDVFATDRIVVPSTQIGTLTVSGAVKKSGVFPSRARATLSTALALADGVTDTADTRVIRIFRDSDQGPQMLNADLRAIQSGIEPDPQILPNDRIVVLEQRGRVSVDGQVTQAGNFTWRDDLTLSRALAEARGMTQFADVRNVLVLRVVDGTVLAGKFDMVTVASGRSPDPLLLPGDRISVETDGRKTWLRDITPLASFVNIAAILANATR
jgi:protein involved in polysaccharide export with SLBB domain